MNRIPEMRAKRPAWTFAAAALCMTLGSGPVAADDDRGGRGGGTWTTTVRCPSKSINDVLASAPSKRALLIHVRGTCRENVTIRRSNVTLQGIDPARSRIIGVPEADVFDESPLTVDSASGIVVDNLTLSGGTSSGFALVSGHAVISNCVIEDNGFNGVAAFAGVVRVDRCTIRNNTLSGVHARTGGLIQVTNSTIESNGVHGVLARNGGTILLGKDLVGEPGPSTVTGNGSDAVLVADGGSAEIANATIESAGPSALSAVRSASVRIVDSSLAATGNGACAAFIGDGSVLRVDGGTALTNEAPGFNCATLAVYRNSTARLGGDGNTIANADPVTGGSRSSLAGGFAVDVEMVSSLRIDGSFATVVDGNVEAFNLATVDLRRIVVNGGVYADGLTANVRLRGNAAGDVVVNGDVFPASDSRVTIRNGGEVVINGNIDCSNGANVRSDFAFFGAGGGYVGCPFGP